MRKWSFGDFSKVWKQFQRDGQIETAAQYRRILELLSDYFRGSLILIALAEPEGLIAEINICMLNNLLFISTNRPFVSSDYVGCLWGSIRGEFMEMLNCDWPKTDLRGPMAQEVH